MAARGSLRLLFSPISKRDAWLLMLPATVLALASGAIPALMTRVLGNAFNAFTAYNPEQLPNSAVPQERRDQLMRSVVTAIWQLCALSAGTVVGNTLMLTLWVIVGEKVASGCRRNLYAAVGSRPMAWFDKGMGMTGGDDSESSSGGGAGGLMARFARETDDMRIAASQTSGQVLQHIAAMVACLALAFASNWSLTLVILSCIPLTMATAIATEIFAAPLMAAERAEGAKLSGLVERSVNAIATIKAFNAQHREHDTLTATLTTLAAINNRLSFVWALRAGLSATLALSMFTSGFAYGSHLVQEGKATPGTVMTVFFAALTATGQLQFIIASLQILEKGKSAAASLQLLTSDDAIAKEEGKDRRSDEKQRDSLSSNGKGKETSPRATAMASSASLLSVEVIADPFADPSVSPPAYSGEPASPSPSMTSFRSTASSRPFAMDYDFVGVLPSGRSAKDRWMAIENIPHSPPVSPDGPLREKVPHSARGRSVTAGPNLSVPLTELTASRHRHRNLASKRSVAAMRKIRPTRCQGEVCLKNLSFAYPSRPDVKVLQDVSLYFAAGETTYLVGGSGSGKSSVASLLLRMYEPSSGLIEIDEQDIRFLDPTWVKSCVSSVDQHPIIFDLSVHDNVALGAAVAAGEVGPNHVPTVDRDAVISACRIALLHNFVEGLPDGYDTQLGAKGASISGGQKQRLAIARAKLRDSPILILDEATSALDLTSRHLVNEAIKRWRKGKTTIIITHDLSSVGSEDFVYLLDKGRVAQQGYRFDLETQPGPFSALVSSQDGGEDQAQLQDGVDAEIKEVLDAEPSPTGLEDRASRVLDEWVSSQRASKGHIRASRWAQRLSWGAVPPPMATQRASTSLATHMVASVRSDLDHSQASHASHHNSWREPVHRFPSPPPRRPIGHTRQAPSVASTDSSVGTTSSPSHRGLRPLRLAEQQQKRKVEEDEGAVHYLESASIAASRRRPLRRAEWEEQPHATLDSRRKWRDEELLATIKVVEPPSHSKRDRKGRSKGGQEPAPSSDDPPINSSLLHILAFSWRTQPRKMGLIVGLVFCFVAGATIPAFSYVLGRLLGTMGIPGSGSQVTMFALIVLALAFADGIANFLRFYMMAFVGDEWVRKLRTVAFANILAQDKAWFDRPSSSAGNLLTRIVKDGDDAQNLFSRIAGQLLQVAAMILIGLTWAMVVGWQLTLVGLAFAPVFMLTVGLQSREVNKREAINKVRREAVAKRFYDMVANVRGIRSMALDSVFAAQFDDAVREAERCAIRAAPVAGAGFGLGDALTYIAEALMYYAGAVLVSKGIYDFTRMVTTFNLILFAVTFAAQTLAFLPGLSKALRATADLEVLVQLASQTSETPGDLKPRIDGAISFQDVSFSYPSRPDLQVLSHVSFTVERGQRVALVGGSGSGKTTVAALLQRLYEPSQGQILFDDSRISEASTVHLRENLAVVSQHPNLFSASVEDNIKYGASSSRPDLVAQERMEEASKLACAHEFVTDLPQGYSTYLGDNISLSGGQAQRLAIARALVRDSARIVILDECTSALDAENQARVAHNVLQRRHGQARGEEGEERTVICVTHKLDMMRRCDRIIVMDQGRVVQQGSFAKLAAERGGAFARLASAGEWGA